MRQGFDRGYNAGCCDGLEIWGVSSDCPNIIHSVSDAYTELAYSVLTGYDELEIRQGQWPRGIGTAWEFHAAKVPGTYPPSPGQEDNRPISSMANGSWSAELGRAGQHIQTTDAFDVITYEGIVDIHFCSGSRAIYVDGQQTYICYSVAHITNDWPTDPIENPILTEAYKVIAISDPTDVDDRQVLTWGGTLSVDDYGHPTYTGATNMEEQLSSALNAGGFSYIFKDILSLSQSSRGEVVQPPCNCINCGKDYLVLSTYYPGRDTWTVARVQYDGPRIGGSGGGMGVFCSELEKIGTAWPGFVGDSAESYTGNYWIVLPSCRTYIDSAVVGSDECWVCAMHKTTSQNNKIVTGQWLSEVYAPGGSNGAVDFADGTLADSEVDNVILDSNSNDFPGELWQNLEVRSYNRVYDPTIGQSRDLLLFTSRDDGVGGIETELDVKATFEGGDLNAGFETAGIAFETAGFNGTDAWVSSTDTPDTGTYSAKVSPENVFDWNNIVLKATFTKVQNGFVTFNVKHDNRSYAERIAPFTILNTVGTVEHYLDIRLDGSLVSGDDLVGFNENIPQFQVDNGAGFVAVSTSRLDNITSPEEIINNEPKFLAYRPMRIYVPAGTHTLSFTQHREFEDNGHMVSQMDELALGEIMTGEDTTGAKRWLYNGQKVQRAEWWSWPLRDDEELTTVDDRFSTAPDYVTFDKLGRILYGNPHYVTRLIPDPNDSTVYILDEDFGSNPGFGNPEGGYVRFTASPAILRYGSDPRCEDPLPEAIVPDTVVDPPWGAFQILPTGSAGDFQVRGVNASMRDASEDPFDPELFTYETPEGETKEEIFYQSLKADAFAGVWSLRAHSWTINGDGKRKRPHVDLIRRPTQYTLAWPEGPWPYKPYETNFADVRRPRDPLRIPGLVTKSRWYMYNYVVSTTFSDARSRSPQATWVRWVGVDPPPSNDPDVSGPWPSAEWFLIQTYGIPTGSYIGMLYEGRTQITCEDLADPNNPIQQLAKFHGITWSASDIRVITDFDVVDVQCVCCD